MTEVDAFIWFDAEGRICAVGHVTEGSAESIEPVAKEGHRIHRTRLARERLDELHLTHRIDPARLELVERGPSAA